jgi:hypothetical protein
MNMLARASINSKLQTCSLISKDYENKYLVEKVYGRESQRACHKDELMGGKQPGKRKR